MGNRDLHVPGGQERAGNGCGDRTFMGSLINFQGGFFLESGPGVGVGNRTHNCPRKVLQSHRVTLGALLALCHRTPLRGKVAFCSPLRSKGTG